MFTTASPFNICETFVHLGGCGPSRPQVKRLNRQSCLLIVLFNFDLVEVVHERDRRTTQLLFFRSPTHLQIIDYVPFLVDDREAQIVLLSRDQLSLAAKIGALLIN